jgi:hypothetical protein
MGVLEIHPTTERRVVWEHLIFLFFITGDQCHDFVKSPKGCQKIGHFLTQNTAKLCKDWIKVYWSFDENWQK